MTAIVRAFHEAEMDPKAHWEKVYHDRGPDQLSRFQAEARLSRELIERAIPDREALILDVGAGASRLVDGLVEARYRRLTLLDLSAAALAMTRSRLGARGDGVTWIEGDVLTASLPSGSVDLWHDRAEFHSQALQAEFGEGFESLESRREEHRTPSGALQAFTYCLCRFLPCEARS